MTPTTIVPDTSVIVKLILDEHDSDVAHAFFDAAAGWKASFLAPELLVYECVSVVARQQFSITACLHTLGLIQDSFLEVVAPDDAVWQRLDHMLDDRDHPDGRIDPYDGVFHAMALEHNGILITADARYARRAQRFGGVVALSDWENAIIR